MYRPDDKDDIDRLSREAAEHYHAPGKPTWEAMRATLDKELPQEKEKRRRGFLFFFLLGLGLAVAGSAIWYGIRKNNNDTNIASTTKHTDKTQPQAKNNASTPENSLAVENAGNTKNRSAIPVATSAANSQKAIPQNNLPVTAASPAKQDAGNTSKNIDATVKTAPVIPSVTNSKENAPAKNNTAFHKNKTAAGSYKLNVLNNNILHKKQAPEPMPADDVVVATAGRTKKLTGHPVKDKTASGKHMQVINSNDIASGDTGMETGTDLVTTGSSIEPPLPPPPPPMPDKLNSKLLPVASTDTTTRQQVTLAVNKDSAKTKLDKVKSKSKNEKAILFGITAGLDLSTVKFTYGSNAGYNIGVMGGYQFSKHWSAYTGIVYTKKNYKLNGNDYHPPDAYWTMNINLQTVEGYCRMWELPLLARYTFNPSSRTAFFTSAGLSSYFMKQQQYDYTYKTSTGTMNSAWSDDKNLNHIFSILDLSAGFEKQMGKHLNFQVEPYAKIPLGGVGFGNIRLSSFGLNLTVQYKQPLKR